MDKHNKDKIVFINQATGYLTIDLINAFADSYTDIDLIAGSIRVQDIELKNNVKWHKICRYNRGNPLKKFVSWIIGTIQIFFLLLFKYRKFEVFYITIPPLAYLLSVFFKNKFSILVFDVYPDVLKIYNVKESSFIYRFWSRLNRKIFAKAYRIYTIGEGMARLLEKYISRASIQVIPLWTGLTHIKPIAKDQNPWLSELNLQDKFIVQYSGNIGVTHNVEVLINIARELQSNTDIHLLIIGRGDRFNNIENLIKEHSLCNCTLLPFQPDDVLKYSLAAADIGVVLLDEKTAHVSVPSKIYNLQAVGIPILGISPIDSELNKHLTQFENGVCFKQDQVKEMSKYLLDLKSNKEGIKQMASNSLRASKHFTNKNAHTYYNDYINN